TVAKIEPEWALRAAEHLVKRQYFDPHYDSRSGQVMAYEKVSLYGLVVIEKRSVSYGRIDAAVSHEVFIRAALVEGKYGDHPKRKHAQRLKPSDDFFAHQQTLLAELDELESKARRRDILADEQVLFDFYAERVPEQVTNFAGFEAWRKKAEAENPRLLYIDRERMMLHAAGGITEAQIPIELEWRRKAFPVNHPFIRSHSDHVLS